MRSNDLFFFAALLSPVSAALGALLAFPAYIFGRRVLERQQQHDIDRRWQKYGHHIREALATVAWYRSLESPTPQQTAKFNMAKEVLWHNNVLH